MMIENASASYLVSHILEIGSMASAKGICATTLGNWKTITLSITLSMEEYSLRCSANPFNYATHNSIKQLYFFFFLFSFFFFG